MTTQTIDDLIREGRRLMDRYNADKSNNVIALTEMLGDIASFAVDNFPALLAALETAERERKQAVEDMVILSDSFHCHEVCKNAKEGCYEGESAGYGERCTKFAWRGIKEGE